MKLLAPTQENIELAGQAIRDGLLVGMPTETVYGIAGNALDDKAVRKIFEVKGRPSENPLIVHTASIAKVLEVASSLPIFAETLAAKFWPGPLTLVLPKLPTVPDAVTAGLDTVAVRVPSHPVALAMITAAGCPLAAPSANPFMGLSPTRADDIDEDLASHLAYVLDGGPCNVGLESTVVDCTGETPRLLRPGGISRQAIEELLATTLTTPAADPKKRSPGLYQRHYSPRTPLRVSNQLTEGDAGITLSPAKRNHQLQLPSEPNAYAAALYATLQRLDRMRLPEIVVEAPPRTPDWEAVWDRITKAEGQGEAR